MRLTLSLGTINRQNSTLDRHFFYNRTKYIWQSLLFSKGYAYLISKPTWLLVNFLNEDIFIFLFKNKKKRTRWGKNQDFKIKIKTWKYRLIFIKLNWKKCLKRIDIGTHISPVHFPQTNDTFVTESRWF